MSIVPVDPLVQLETTCGTLLYELQIIWDEVGESDAERDKMLLELERECLEVCRRKVDQANKSRAQLKRAIADSEAELAAICSAMGERPVHIRQSDQNPGNLKAELRAILPQIEEMWKRKCDRKNQFLEVLEQIQKIKCEIYRSTGYTSTNILLDETDLSLRKLEELHRELHALQTEKSERLKKVLDHLNTLNSLCLVLGMDFKQIVGEVHPSLGESEGTKSISNDTIEQLAAAIQGFREIKMQRKQRLQDLATASSYMYPLQRKQRLQDLATSMLELWNLMDTPIEEQQTFQNVTANIAASEDEITEPNMLSVDFIKYVEAEVSRLEEMKTSKMKELVLKKRFELEDICRKTHMIPESDSALDIAIEAIESGAVDAASVLEQIELQISKVKEEAFCRKEILEKVEKWMAACEEECWLEEYNRDDNRYNAGRGAHLTLKRAEKARALVNKLPAMVEALASKTTAWENERGIEFTYDGIRLLSMLEEYNILHQEKEIERKRQRDQKKLQGQLITEQEALYGSKPSPMKCQSGKKGPRLSCGGGASNRRLSLGGTMMQTPNTRQAKKNERLHQNDHSNLLRDEGIASLSAGRRGLDIAGLPVKKHSFGAVSSREGESPMVRKPFSPISSTDSSKSNAANIFEDPNKKHNDMLQKTLSSNNTSFATPSKIISAVEEENKTPKPMTVPVPSTPATVSVPMQTAITPAPSVILPLNSKPVDEIPEEIEYSFEERRAGFVLPKTPLKTVMLQV